MLFSKSFMLKFVYKILELASSICLIGETSESYFGLYSSGSFVKLAFDGSLLRVLLWTILFSILCISKWTAWT